MSPIVVRDRHVNAMLERRAIESRCEAIRNASQAARGVAFVESHAALIAAGSGLGLLLSLAAMQFGIV